MPERHVDAHWDCENCGEPLVRGWSTQYMRWSYSSAINGEVYCREPPGNQNPSWPSERIHIPALPDLSTIDATEEYLAR